jgi:hypothetical protein
MDTTITQLLAPLREDEKPSLTGAVLRLFHNEDFQLVFRWMNQTCGGVFATVFTQSSGTDAIKAGLADGSKAHVRWLLDTYLSRYDEKPEKPTEQL